MFNLAEEELQNAFDAIEHHGYGGLLPPPLEWGVLKDDWPAIRAELSGIDLDLYQPVAPLRTYAPKNRATVRVVSLLHPVDLIFYTALTLLVKNDLEQQRVPKSRRTVFSFRTDVGVPNRLYPSSNAYSAFRKRLENRVARATIRYVALADIADFYPRIYQHRLQNVIDSCARSERHREVARVLAAKLISNISGKNSYGLPVGPYASRLLAEAVLIDVDSFLLSEGIDYVRWVDDYFFFTRTEQQAQEILISLAERLYDLHGLTLSALKTKIVSATDFRRRFEAHPEKDVDESFTRFVEFTSRFDPYSEEEIELSDAEREEIAAIDLSELIERALEDRDLVDYETLSALLRHPDLFSIMPQEVRQRLADILLKNVQHLYPIAEDVSGFFSSLVQLPWQQRKKIKNRLLKSIEPKHGRWPPDYYVLWILSIFAGSSEWRESPEFAHVFRDHRSEIVRRAAALAISVNGSRADAVAVREHYSASPLCKLAILLATRKLGKDERKHWKTSLQLTGPLEKRI